MLSLFDNASRPSVCHSTTSLQRNYTDLIPTFSSMSYRYLRRGNRLHTKAVLSF